MTEQPARACAVGGASARCAVFLIVMAALCLHTPQNVSVSGVRLSAQATTLPRSVWLEDYPGGAPAAAVAGGRTTLIYSAGSSLAVENHVEVARYVAQRVAEELTNAFVLPIVQGPAPGAEHIATTLSEAVGTGGFRHVVILADEDTRAGETSLEDLARRFGREWTPKGIRVYYVTAHEMRPGQGMTFNSDYLRRWASRTIPAARRKSVEDFSELLFVDRNRRWLRDEMIPLEDRAWVSAELGKILVEQRVSSILDQIRALSPSHVRPPFAPATSLSRLPFIPEEKITPALEQALAEYKKVRPDGLNPGRSGGPSLWRVYMHLPEVMTPLRQLHEQVHANPRLSQKIVHFIILITGRHWTNDIWTAHEEDGIKDGLSRETIRAIEEGRYPTGAPEDEQIIYDFCTELLANQRVSDATYARALAKFGEEGVVQAAVTVGLYSYLSLAVNMAYPESASRGRLAPFPQ